MDAITDILGQELQRLAEIVNPVGVPVIIGGGYGLLLRQRYIENGGHRTIRAIPLARSTQDLDLFLTVEFVLSRSIL